MSSCCANQQAANQQDEQQQQQLQASKGSLKWRIRPMRHDDIEKCLEIWRRVELTEAQVTVASVLTTDPAGFHVAELESTGSVVGMCSGAMTREDTAFMGFYAVEPEFQGIGIGRELWARTVARLERANHNIGLYGVPAMSAKYKKSGFVLEDSVRMLIYESRPGERLALGSLKQLHELQQDAGDHTQQAHGWRLEEVSGRTSAWLVKKLVDFDERVNGHSRERLLRTYLTDAPQLPLTVALLRTGRSQPASPPAYSGGERKSSCCLAPSQAVIKEDEALSTSVKGSLSISAINSVGGGGGGGAGVAGELHLRSTSPIDIPSPVAVAAAAAVTTGNANNLHHHLQTSGELMGYGCIRHDNTGGAMIGPLYARSDEVHEVLLRELVSRLTMRPGGKYSAMSLSSNERAGRTLERLGFEELDQCSRMFTRFVPQAALDQVYLVHSPNFTLF